MEDSSRTYQSWESLTHEERIEDIVSRITEDGVVVAAAVVYHPDKGWTFSSSRSEPWADSLTWRGTTDAMQEYNDTLEELKVKIDAE
jgi:sugar phosphate isomerase/epimerase